MYLLIVSGLSGAGKSQALRKLEDMEFFCVDNLPAKMLGSFVQLCAQAEPQIIKAALVIDSRVSVFGSGLDNMFEELNMLNINYDIMFLECNDNVLEMRYNETRRRHPKGVSGDIRSGIILERELLQHIKERAKFLIDTTSLKPQELHRLIERYLNMESGSPFTLILSSFGYKRGVPFESDIVMDMRFSPNPFYEPELRNLSGLDEAVQKYVLSNQQVADFLDDFEKMLNKLIPSYIEQEKYRLMVSFGCTGGRHRSVCVAQNMYQRMKNKYNTILIHRDLESEAQAIADRFSKA